MANKTSETVKGAIARMYAILAAAMAQKALDSARENMPNTADGQADRAAEWLKKAGAAATRYSYKDPK